MGITRVGVVAPSQAVPFPGAPVSPICHTRPSEVTATVKFSPTAKLTTAKPSRPPLTLRNKISFFLLPPPPPPSHDPVRDWDDASRVENPSLRQDRRLCCRHQKGCQPVCDVRRDRHDCLPHGYTICYTDSNLRQ